ncbi:MAG: hypothetical protein HOW73_12595 [Polyangiaceae bacterium]|nr:hypothetical protein [Polyangiaceae bacterium]
MKAQTTKMRVAPVVPLGARLDIPSLVIIEGPADRRGLRIRLDAHRELAPEFPARGFLMVGGAESDVPLPEITPFMVAETREGDFLADAPGRYSRGAARRAPLPAYATFEHPPFTFMFLPPTPDGLGIPPDYSVVTVAKAQPVGVPSLLVKAGYTRAMGRKFPLVDDRITIGGSLGVHVPLFRLRHEVGARLTRGVGELSYFVEPASVGCKVMVVGQHADRNILTAYASLVVDEWELTLLPAVRGVP